MSESTKRDMEDAIQAHFASECADALLSGYVIQMHGSNVEDIGDAGVRTLREVPDTQNIVTTMGLIAYMNTTTNDLLSWGADEE